MLKTSNEIRKGFIEFFKKHNHEEIPNASLIPINDPSVLFTTAGMHPLVPYLLGQEHPKGRRLTNVQRCLRTDDIDEVGDTIHLTFFEMLGFWSLGDYFKEEAVNLTFEFLTSEDYMGFDPSRLYVSVFEGNSNTPQDETSIKAWKEKFSSVDIEANVYEGDLTKDNLRIFPLGPKENWWGPAGITGPCGPDTEIFYWRGEGEPDFKKYSIWDESGMFIEIGNDVFMEFNKDEENNFTPLIQKNVDFGGGFERFALVAQLREKDGSIPISKTVFDTDLFKEALEYLKENSNSKNEDASRRILDHMRASIFLLADGVIPGNKDQGYILRRLIRRAITKAMFMDLPENWSTELCKKMIDIYKDAYPNLLTSKDSIISELSKEFEKFDKALKSGKREFEKIVKQFEENETEGEKILSGEKAFFLFESFGLPLESIEELSNEAGLTIDTTEFEERLSLHQEKSRAGAKQKFKGGLADDSEITTKLHTTHHLLLKALQTVLGDQVKQRGSNINAERLRIDFSFDRKLTPGEILEVESIVNDAIKKELEVKRVELPLTIAEKIGAQMEFRQNYPDTVSVYFVGLKEGVNPEEATPEDYFSAEFCGGPHVENTSQIGEYDKVFKVLKQESSSAGVRRIKAGLV